MLVLNFNVREMGSVRRSEAAQPAEECEHIQTLNSPKCHRSRYLSHVESKEGDSAFSRRKTVV